VLLFDLGGVLVQTKVFSSVKDLLAQGGQDQDFDDQDLRDRWLSSPAVRDFELGRISPPVFAKRFTEEWRAAVSPASFLQDFAGWIEQPYPGAEELLAQLRREHHVSCLTNCNPLHWGVLAPFLTHFDSSFSSHLLGQVKPDEGAFRSVMEVLDVEPGAVRFFDDSRANVVGARNVGIKAFLVHGPDEARRVLQEEGVL
jgi:HAD superfamily hydrolase (TIGR01509 family)